MNFLRVPTKKNLRLVFLSNSDISDASWKHKNSVQAKKSRAILKYNNGSSVSAIFYFFYFTLIDQKSVPAANAYNTYVLHIIYRLLLTTTYSNQGSNSPPRPLPPRNFGYIKSPRSPKSNLTLISYSSPLSP